MGALLALCMTASPLAAQDRPVRGVALNWVRLPGAEACIPPVELATRVERRLGRPVFVRTADAIIVIEGRVGAAPSGGFEMVLAVSDPDGRAYGSRELQVPGSDCGKLSELAALIVSITIRHEGRSGIELPAEVAAQLSQLFADEPAELDPSSLPPVEVASVQSASEATPAASVEPASAREWFARVEVDARLTTGITPSASLGPMLRLGAAHAGWGSAALSGGFGLSQTQRAPDEAQGELRYQPWQIGFRLCWEALRAASFELSLCADGAVGSVSVRAEGFMQNLSASKLFAEVGPGVGLRASVWGPSYLQLRVGAPVRVVRPGFQFVSSSGMPRSAFSLAPVGFALELGVGVEF